MAILQRLMTEAGVALLFYRIELPDAVAESELAESLLSRVIAYLEGELTERLRAEYLASGDPMRRFVFRRADYRLTVTEREGALLAALRLSRGGRTLYEQTRRFALRADAELLPLDEYDKIKTIKQAKKCL